MPHARIDRHEVSEAADEQQRGDEHDDGHRDLRGHHQPLNQQALVAGRRSPAAGLHRRDRVDASRANRRCNAEDDACGRGDNGRKQQNAPIGRERQVGRASAC